MYRSRNVNKNKNWNNNGNSRSSKSQWKENRQAPFVNPYNFITISDKNECKRDDYNNYYKDEDKLITGWLECRLEPKTPIFIPNTSNDDAFGLKNNNEVKSYDFFSYDNIAGKDRNNKYSEPVIPGSEIRGVIRSAFEAVTNSCLSTIDLNMDLYKRTVDPKKPGILWYENDQWYLQRAERVMVKYKKCDKDKASCFNEIKKYKEGQIVYFTKSKEKYKSSNNHHVAFTIVELRDQNYENAEKGYIHKGQDFSRKHHESIFIEDKNENKEKISNDVVINAINNFNKVVKLYNDTKINNKYRTEISQKNNNKWYEHYIDLNNVSDNKPYLVYYSKVADKLYMSPACITKEVFYHSLKDILEKQGKYYPCNSKKLCRACALFGTVINKGKKSISVSSRIRFTDAKAIQEKENNQYYDKEIILNELSSPKISATEFYLERPDKLPAMWNYDYAYYYKGKYKDYLSDYEPMIRGRKFYWHSKTIKSKIWQENYTKYNDRTCIVRPLKASKEDDKLEFKFKVYFDKIHKDDLNLLIWILNIGSNNNLQCHKIGKGKPIGYGSIKIKVDNKNVRYIKEENEDIKYDIIKEEVEDIDYNKYKILDKESIEQFLKITDFANCPVNVKYPMGDDGKNKDNSKAGHQWFTGNKGNNFMKPKITKALPEILKIEDKDKQLYEYIKK